MVAALSPEGRIDTGLRSLQCSGRNFIEIAKALGARVGTGSFSESLNGKRTFDRETGERLLEILSRMRELQDSVSVPVDWARVEEITNALTTRLVANIAGEIGLTERDELSKMAEKARSAVAQQ